jgi:hypothetical protein
MVVACGHPAQPAPDAGTAATDPNECEYAGNVFATIGCTPLPASVASNVTTVDFAHAFGVQGTMTIPGLPRTGRFVGGIDGVTCSLQVPNRDGNPSVDSSTGRGTCVLTVTLVTGTWALDGKLAVDALPDTVDGERVQFTETF